MQTERITLSDADRAIVVDTLIDCEFVETQFMDVSERREFYADQSDAAISRAIRRMFGLSVADYVASS
jgi:hypothetical protein